MIKNQSDLKNAIERKRKNGTLTRGQTIKLHCLDCCAYSSNEVTRCNNTNCPLWEFRKGVKIPLDEAT